MMSLLPVAFGLLFVIFPRHLPFVNSVARTASSPQAARPQAEDVLRALLSSIELQPDDRVAAGPLLDAAVKEHLRAALDGNLSPILSSPGNLIAATIVTVDDVRIQRDTATVRLTYGPVPHDPRLACGLRLTFVLALTTTWALDEDKTWAECASKGKRAASDDEESLREVFRLAMTEWGVGANDKLVAGSQLSPLAQRVLSAAGRVYTGGEIRTNEFTLPHDAIQVNKLTITEGIAEVAAWRGPVFVSAMLACGKGLSVRMRRQSEGWAFIQSSVTVC